MIIHSLAAENLFRFTQVHLKNLPKQGLIAIDGDNESGKSSLLEMLLLGLYGRTSRLHEESLARAVKWGTHQASLTMLFSGNDQRLYQVIRYLDPEGGHRANLSLADDPKNPLVKGVSGVNAAIIQKIGLDFETFMSCLNLGQQGPDTPRPNPQVLRRISGVDYLEKVAEELSDEVIEMATESQNSGHEIEKIEEELEDLDVMMGSLDTLHKQLEETLSTRHTLDKQIRQIRRFSMTLQDATRHLTESPLQQLTPNDDLDLWQKELEGVESAMDGLDRLCQGNKLGVDEAPTRLLRPLIQRRISALGELRTLMGEIRKQGEKWRHWLAEDKVLHAPFTEKEQDATTYPIRRATLQHKRDSKVTMQHRSGWLFGLTMLLTAATTTLWYMAQLAVVEDPGITTSDHGLLMQLLGSEKELGPRFTTVLAVEGSIALLSGLSFWLYTLTKHRVSKRIHALDQQAKYGREQFKRLDALIKRPMLSRFLEMITLTDAPWSERLNRWFGEMGNMFMNTPEAAETKEVLRQHMDEVADKLALDRQVLDHRLEKAQTERESLTARLDQLEQAIDEENERRERDEVLREALQSCHTIHRTQRHGVRVREVSLGLLQGAQKACNSRFQQELKRCMSTLAPRFTGQHYRYLELDKEMNLRTRTGGRDALVPISDLSTGAQRQLQLVLRLTLAKAITAHSVSGNQCMLLDEPFAFFDKTRTEEAMQALCQLSAPLSQLWVATQSFSEVLAEEGLVRITCRQDQESLIVDGNAL
ncbi:AAA family ATPase [Magnetococcus sp. PR-3]|uniref:AAA family ATPase n=1 Tax=Magnetococcus sp. PR-3 TaxID=3120355 RepID=UPI002FCE13F5